MSKMVRIQFELPEEKVAELENLMSTAKIATKKDLLNNALTVLEWIIQEKRAGRIIASLDERSKHYKELVMPIFSALSSGEKVA